MPKFIIYHANGDAFKHDSQYLIQSLGQKVEVNESFDGDHAFYMESQNPETVRFFNCLTNHLEHFW